MELDELVVKITADTDPLAKSLADIGKEANTTLSGITKLGDRISSSFASAVVKGESLSSILKSILSDIASTTISSSISSATGSILDSVIGSLFGRATGGSVNSGTPYLVGERGPELFVPSSAGRINANANTSAIAGDSANTSSVGTVSVNVDARGADSGAAERLRAAASEIEQRTFNAVFSAMNRGGRYARMSGRR